MTSTEVIPEFSAQSKFQKLTGPLQQLPHKCASCYRYDNPDPDREGHLDFVTWNQDIEYYGIIYICTDCLREIVNQIGWATDIQVKRASNMIKDLLAQVSHLSEENENLRNAVGNLSTIAVGGAVAGRDFMVGVEAGDETIGGESGVADEPVNESEELGATDEESDGPADEPGSTDVLDDDSLSKLLDEI